MVIVVSASKSLTSTVTQLDWTSMSTSAYGMSTCSCQSNLKGMLFPLWFWVGVVVALGLSTRFVERPHWFVL